MRRYISIFIAMVFLGGMFACAGQSMANTAVVDVPRLLTESKPGKAAEEHLKQVLSVLQKGLEDLQTLYKGKEKTEEAQNALQQGYAALEKQMGLERQAVLQVLGGLVEQATKTWRKGNSKYTMVVSTQMMLDSDATLHVTDAVMKEMDKLTPTFAALPTVTVNSPKDEKKNEVKKPAAPPQPKR